MRISLVITVDDLAGYDEGLPAILHLLEQYKIKATFLFALGYDNTGLRVKNLFKPRELTRQLPWMQKIRGTLLPPVTLSKKFSQSIKACQAAGHELGIRSFNPVNWQFQALDADRAWTRQQLQWAIESFQKVFAESPKIHSAVGQVINRHLLSLESHMGFEVALDTRGKTAFYPRYHDITGTVLNLPFTLPGIEELIATGNGEVSDQNVHEYLLVESQKQLPQGHFFEVRAAFEGRRWLPVLERMIVMWRSFNWEFCTISEIQKNLKDVAIPVHQVGWAAYQPGNIYCSTQGLAVESDVTGD